MLISDYHAVSNLQIIEEASAANNHRPKVRGLFQRADEANQNKRVYPRPLLEAQVNKLQPLIKERRLCGELDHPQNDTVKLTNASHLVTKLWMEGNEVMGEAEILNTPAGKVAQALINDGVKIGISSRGLGTLSEDQMTGTKTVNEDFNLVTFDLVADPSTRGAYPTIAESRILEEAKYERTLKEAVKERTFITMLKNKLNEAAKGDREFWDSEDFGQEPEHLAARRRANKLAQDKINKEAVSGKKKPPIIKKRKRGEGDDVWHSQDFSQITGKRARRADESLKDRVRSFLYGDNSLEDSARTVVEDAMKGYPEMGIRGGTKAAKREARKRKKKC